MTMSTAIVSEHTTPEDRSSELSRLTAAMTVSFIVGPALGSRMYQRDKRLPPLVRGAMPCKGSIDSGMSLLCRLGMDLGK